MTYGELIAEWAKEGGLKFQRFLMTMSGLLVHHAEITLNQPVAEMRIGKEILQKPDAGIKRPTPQDIISVLWGGQWLRQEDLDLHLMRFLPWFYACQVSNEDGDYWDLAYPQNMVKYWNQFAYKEQEAESDSQRQSNNSKCHSNAVEAPNLRSEGEDDELPFSDVESQE